MGLNVKMRRIIGCSMLSLSYGVGMLLFFDNISIEALKGSTIMITPAVGRQATCNGSSSMPSSLLSYTSHRIRYPTTRIHSMTIDPRTGLSVTADGLDGDAGDEGFVASRTGL